MMRHRWFRTPAWPRIAAAALVSLATAACTSATARGHHSAPAPTLTFENVTVDPVTVYLDHGGSRRMLGHVEPSRRAQLRIPDFGALHDVSDLRVIVVPLGTARKRDGTPDLASAVVSKLEPAQYLVSMLWSLTGRTLTSVALPRLRR